MALRRSRKQIRSTPSMNAWWFYRPAPTTTETESRRNASLLGARKGPFFCIPSHDANEER